MFTVDGLPATSSQPQGSVDDPPRKPQRDARAVEREIEAGRRPEDRVGSLESSVYIDDGRGSFL